MNAYLTIARLRDRMTANRNIQDICQSIVRLLLLVVSIGVILNTIESAFIVSRIQLGIIKFATSIANILRAETNNISFDSS